MSPTTLNNKVTPAAQTNLYRIDRPMHFPLIRSHLNGNCDLPRLFCKSTGGGELSERFIDEGRRIQEYVKLLMPLMFETWMEVRPQYFGQEFDEDLVITNEAAATLKTILEIIQRLTELISVWDANMNNDDLSRWFRDTYNKEFCAQIFVAFPYSQTEGHKGSKRKAAKNLPSEQDVHEAGGQKCHVQNLCVSYIFSVLNPNVGRSYLVQAQSVTNYLTSEFTLRE